MTFSFAVGPRPHGARVLFHTYIKHRIFPDVGHFACAQPWALYCSKSSGSHRASPLSLSVCHFLLLSVDIWRVRHLNDSSHPVHPETSSSATLYPPHCMYPNSFMHLFSNLSLFLKCLPEVRRMDETIWSGVLTSSRVNNYHRHWTCPSRSWYHGEGRRSHCR